MVRRRKKQANKSFVYFIVTFIVLILIGLLVSGVFEKKITENIHSENGTGNTVSETENIYKDSVITGNGKIVSIPYDMKIGSNFKILMDGKEVYVKSTKYLLDDYVDKIVDFKGNVIGFSVDNTPVVDITYISISNLYNDEQVSSGDVLTGDNSTGDVVENKNIYKFKTLEFNLENTSYGFKNNGDSAVVFLSGENLSGNNELLKIESFVCKKGSSIYDCKKLTEQAKMYGFSKIVSDNGLVFYQLPESNTYMLLTDKYGYNLYPLKGELFNYVNYISKSELSNTNSTVKKKAPNKKPEINIDEVIKNTCKNDKIVLTHITDKKVDNNTYTILGYDSYSNKVKCIFTLEQGTTAIAKLVDLSYVADNSNKLDENKYLVYKSRGYGYTVYMPKSTKFKSILIKNDFGVSGLNCKQQINIASWKDGDVNDPDVKLVYCDTQLATNTIKSLLGNKWSNYKIKKENGKVFIIIKNKNTDTANKIADGIILY